MHMKERKIYGLAMSRYLLIIDYQWVNDEKVIDFIKKDNYSTRLK